MCSLVLPFVYKGGFFSWVFLRAAIAWRLINLLAAVASHSRSLIDVSPFTFDITLADCSIFWISLTNVLACMMVGFVIFCVGRLQCLILARSWSS